MAGQKSVIIPMQFTSGGRDGIKKMKLHDSTIAVGCWGIFTFTSKMEAGLARLMILQTSCTLVSDSRVE